MATPGFTAEASLRPGTHAYTHGAPASFGGEISPQFLDFIKEAVESVGSALSTAAQGIASSIASSLSSLGKGGGGNPNQPFVCSTFVGSFMSCSGNSAALSSAQIAQQCVSRAAEVPELLPLCAGLAVSIYALAGEYCKNPSQDVTPFIQQACAGS
jgi:hypothetical protein